MIENKNYTPKNVLLCVDTKNMIYCMSKTFGREKAKLNYPEYINVSVGDDTLFRGIAYGVYNGDETYKFISFLKKCGFNTQFINAVESGGKYRYIGCQVQLTIDVINMVNTGKIDRVILGVTGLEYGDLIRWVRDKGVRCEIYACSIPNYLRNIADKYTEITDNLISQENVKVE